MTRRFWAGLMLVALLLAGGSAYVLLQKMAEPPPQTVRLKSVPPPKPAAVAASSAAAVAVSSAPAKPAQKPAPALAEKPVDKPAEAKPEPAEKPAPKGKRNIQFRYNHAAKEVFLLAEFTHWKRQPLKKDAKGWTINVPLAPGRYEYAFVVDGKKIRDPNNRQSANNGRVSVLTVKPLAKR